MEEADSALEQFRQQWREEVIARSKNKDKRKSDGQQEAFQRPKPALRPPHSHPAALVQDDDEGHGAGEAGPSMIERIEGLVIRSADEDEFTTRGSSVEPRSALEHYEKAVEKESQGNLGESLSHYRKAYRLDARVDQSYKSKHFPPRSNLSNLTNPNPSNAPVTAPLTAHHSSKEPTGPLPTNDLMGSFARVRIVGAEPMIEGDRPPPCPISRLPSEVLLEILLQVAILDPASYVRLGMTCKGLAYHIYSETNIWKRIALGAEFGLASQQYDFSTDVQGREAIDRVLDSKDSHLLKIPITIPQHDNHDWREVFHSHPRIRFTGVYISTVNYTRPGGASASAASWNSPVHIVTYYRFLRFFRDGTVISLLTTYEPIEVVQYLTKASLDLVRSSNKEHHPLNFVSSASALANPVAPVTPPTAQVLMRHALRGRWRLRHPSQSANVVVSDIATGRAGAEGDLHIETEGAGPRYTYTMHLSLKSSSRSTYSVKNNKLQWKGFWSYNNLTNDWAEFQLKNDKAFLFSRVKSYGLGYQ